MISWKVCTKKEKCESAQLKTVLELYNVEIHLKISMPNYQKLKTMVKRSIDQKLRPRNFDARHGRNQTGAVVKNRKGMSGVEGGKGVCYQWKEKGQCSKGDQCSFRHESNDRAQKPDHNAATPSEPSLSRGRSVSKKRSIQCKNYHGAILRQPCSFFLKGICTRSPCEYWHPPECQVYKTETGCKAGDKCLFPHHKVDEQPNKKPMKWPLFLTKEEKATTRMLWLLLKFFPLKEENSPGETRCKDSWDQFEKYDSLSLRHVQQVFRKRKDHRIGKIQVKNPHQRSPCEMKI